MTLPVDTAAAELPGDPLVARLRSDAVANVGGGAALIGFGLIGSLALVWLLTVMLWLGFGLPGIGFRGWFFVLLILYAAAAVAWLPARPRHLVVGAFEYIDPRQEWLGVGRFGKLTPLGAAADLALTGPRMLWAGVEERRGHEPPSRERFFDRCALLLRQLGRAGTAIPLAGVEISEDETGPKLRPVLDYLERQAWIGLNSDRSRIWLSSRAKNDLLHLGIVAEEQLRPL